MPTYSLVLEYDGSDFHGWQIQPGQRTVAGELIDALQRISGEAANLTAAGRTDAGAHAHGQVAGVSLQRPWDPERLRQALNAVLPDDVAVVSVAPRDDGFHARRDAVDRTYRYVIVARNGRAPVTRRHSWTVRGPLDVRAMEDAAAHLVGTHDFAAFGSPPNAHGRTVRTVHEISLQRFAAEEGGPPLDAVVLTVRADAFLRGMVRAIAGALVSVGQGRISANAVRDMIDGPARTRAPLPVAPARGLHQWAVTYGSYTIAGAAA